MSATGMVRGLLMCTVVVLTAAGSVRAALPQQTGTVRLPDEAGARLVGSGDNNLVGGAVAIAGDVNGDGVADSVVGDQRAAGGAGQVIVSFGSSALLPSSFAALGAGGFTIAGAPGDKAGASVAGVGDVNGDGLEDVVVGTQGGGIVAPGRAYVVFGSASTAPVGLASLGGRGFEIDGSEAGDLAGAAVAGAGDVDGDGLEDVIVGAPLAGPLARSTAGAAFVVYGRTATTPVDLAAPGTAASAIDGPAASAWAGTAVAGLGDMNGDGFDDVVVGAPHRKVGINDGTGAAYVVFGSAGRADIDLAALSAGFAITGNSADNNAGNAVAGPGDVTGDGVPDVLVGAPGVHPGPSGGNVNQGRAYVVAGSATPSDVALGAGPGPGHAFRFDGVAAGDLVGSAVAGAGDVDDDGSADVLVASKGTNGLRGAAYVIYGPITQDVALTALGAAGITITDPTTAAGGAVGSSLAGGHDLDGDGHDDVLVGEDHADPPGTTNAGSVYALRGFGAPALAYGSAIAGTAGEAVAAVVPSLVRRTGPASFSAAGLPAGLAVDAATGVVSGTPGQAAQGTATVTMTDLAGSADASVAFDVAAAAVPPAGPPPAPPVVPAPLPKPVAPLRDLLTPHSAFARKTIALKAGATLVARGTASDTAPRGLRARVTKVRVAVARTEANGRCRFATASGRLGSARPCARTAYLTASGTTRWTLRVRHLPRGRYKLWSRAIDAAGNVERKDRTKNFTRLTVR